MERSYAGEPDFAPLFLWSCAGIVLVGTWASIRLFDRLRAQRARDMTPETVPDGSGEPIAAR